MVYLSVFRWLSELWKRTRFPIRPVPPEIVPEHPSSLLLELEEAKQVTKSEDGKKKKKEHEKASPKRYLILYIYIIFFFSQEFEFCYKGLV
jgi:hypothetical protein